MENHVLRPLYVFAVVLVLALFARSLAVPKSFGIGERGYMYGWHRKDNEAEWKALKPKFKGAAYCGGCHEDKYNSIRQSPHKIINCENCHGPARDHPENPEKLEINRSRDLCLRCHYELPYAASGRAHIPGVNPEFHNPGIECANCHNPHKPNDMPKTPQAPASGPEGMK